MERPNVLSLETVLQTLRAHREELQRRFGVRRMAIFGSLVRGEAGPQSDVDILVEFEPGRGLLNHAGLMLYLQSLLGCPVDVVTVRGLKPRFREKVLHEAIVV